jgi:D-sedoheptulose 7-phosphate isomerase
MKKKLSFKNYFLQYCKILNDTKQTGALLKKIYNFKKKRKGKIILLGNGGSSSICSHIATDLVKSNNIRAISFSDHNLITCFGNDYGFENWMSKALEAHCDYNEDLVILISSSGNSKNLINAAKLCKKKKISFVTMTGFDKKNPLSAYGNINVWVNSKSYNYVEVAHLQILAFIVDTLK